MSVCMCVCACVSQGDECVPGGLCGTVCFGRVVWDCLFRTSWVGVVGQCAILPLCVYMCVCVCVPVCVCVRVCVCVCVRAALPGSGQAALRAPKLPPALHAVGPPHPLTHPSLHTMPCYGTPLGLRLLHARMRSPVHAPSLASHPLPHMPPSHPLTYMPCPIRTLTLPYTPPPTHPPTPAPHPALHVPYPPLHAPPLPPLPLPPTLPYTYPSPTLHAPPPPLLPPDDARLCLHGSTAAPSCTTSLCLPTWTSPNTRS